MAKESILQKNETIILILRISSITVPQDANIRLVLQVAEWFAASLYQCQT